MNSSHMKVNTRTRTQAEPTLDMSDTRTIQHEALNLSNTGLPKRGLINQALSQNLQRNIVSKLSLSFPVSRPTFLLLLS
jgi:hypothetical protein